MSMHDYQENEDEEEFEEEQEPEESNYDDDNGLLDVPPEPAPASTRIVLQPDSIEAIIGSGFKAGNITANFLPTVLKITLSQN